MEYNRPLTIVIDDNGSILITADGYSFSLDYCVDIMTVTWLL